MRAHPVLFLQARVDLPDPVMSLQAVSRRNLNLGTPATRDRHPLRLRTSQQGLADLTELCGGPEDQPPVALPFYGQCSGRDFVYVRGGALRARYLPRPSSKQTHEGHA